MTGCTAVFLRAGGSLDSSPFYLTPLVLHKGEHLRSFGLSKLSFYLATLEDKVSCLFCS